MELTHGIGDVVNAQLIGYNLHHKIGMLIERYEMINLLKDTM